VCGGGGGGVSAASVFVVQRYYRQTRQIDKMSFGDVVRRMFWLSVSRNWDARCWRGKQRKRVSISVSISQPH